MAKFADEIKVTQATAGGPVRIYVDGEEFPWFTCDGLSTTVEKGEIPAVRVTIPAQHVEVVQGVKEEG